MCSFERKFSHQDMIKMIRLRNAKLERKKYFPVSVSFHSKFYVFLLCDGNCG